MNRHESAKMPWKILNHPDKLFSEVTTRQMTEEERQKYGEAMPTQKKMMGEEEYMKSLGISTEQLIEDCKKHGTGWVSAKTIAEKYDNVTQKQIYGLIKNRGIKKLLEIEKVVLEGDGIEEPVGIMSELEKCAEHKDCVITEHKGYKEHSLGMPKVKSEGGTKGIAINFADFEAKPRLKPKIMSSQTLNGFDYEIYDNYLEIRHLSDNSIDVMWHELDDFIKDLQELKIIAGE